jgi:glucokinase
MASVVVGIDLGGTIVRAGALSLEGKLLAVKEQTIEARRGPQIGMARIQTLIGSVCRDSDGGDLLGVGIGCSGPVDPENGVISNPHTLPTWENVPIVAWLTDRLGVPVALENDADVAALGEYWQGAGKNVSRLYAVTVGTGIGAALIIDGQIYRGLDGAHPDGGHHVVDPSGPVCYCGAHGCWESLTSGSAIARRAQERISEFPLSQILEMAGGDPSRINARLVAEAAQLGDPFSEEIMAQAANFFSLGLINIVMLFVPEVIVLSGGVMKSVDLFMPAIQNVLRKHDVMVPASRVRVIPAALGYYAGLYGAAYTIIKRL